MPGVNSLWMTDVLCNSYMPGWDCHGLPIENKALQELSVCHHSSLPVLYRLAPAKLDSVTAPPNSIRTAADATAKREIESQKAQFHHFGIMADWSAEATYRTLGTRCLSAVSISR